MLVDRGDRRSAGPRRPACRAAGCGGRPRSCRRAAGTRSPRVLKQCGQVATILRAPTSLSTSTFCRALHLEEELVAEPAGRVAGAGLALAEDRELDAGDVQQLGEGLGGLLGAVLSAPAQPTQNRYSTSAGILAVLADHPHLEVELLGPLQACLRGVSPHGLPLFSRFLQHRARLGRERRLDHHLVAAHVDDVVDVLDVDRALLDAGAAGRAGPQHVGVDDAAVGDRARPADARPRRARPRSAWRARRPARPRRRPAGTAPWRTAWSRRSMMSSFGRQRLAGVPGRALRLAAAALGAGREVEQALPGEVLDLAAAEDVVLARVLEVDLLVAGVHRQQRAEARSAGGRRRR